MRNIRLASIAALTAVVALQMAACAPAPATAAGAGDTLYVGVAANRRPATEAYFEGVRLAIEHLNAERSPLARPLAMLAPPDSLTGAVEMASFFRDHPAVIGVVGHTGSGQTREAAPIYGDVQGEGARAVVAVSPTATHPALAKLSDWIFRVCPTDDDAARALARFARDSLRARRAAIIYRNDLFGRGFTRLFAPAYEQGGGTVVERDPYLAGITDYEAYAARLTRRRADVVVIAGGAQDAADMIRTIRRLGGTPHVVGTDDIAGMNADPQQAREFAGVRYTAFYLPGELGARRFERDYYREFGRAPEHRAALSYDAAMLIGRAVHEVGADRRKVRDHIAGIGITLPAFRGVTGDIRFDAHGDPIAKPVLLGEVRP